MKTWVTIALIVLVYPLWAATITVGTKRHTESRLLGEIIAQAIEKTTTHEVDRRFGLGGTLICFEAITSGEIDIYPEYTGTAWLAILNRENIRLNETQLFNKVDSAFQSKHNLSWMAPFGFNNTYAFAVPEAFSIDSISELKEYPNIKAGFSHEFLNRPDGLPGIEQYYGLKLNQVTGMDHGLVYRAIESGSIELTDAYSTDGQLVRFDLKLLRDDKSFFPPYYASPVVRQSTLKTYPELEGVLNRLGGTLSDSLMRSLNFRVEVKRESFAAVAADFLEQTDIAAPESSGYRLPDLFWRIIEHLQLTGLAVFLAIVIGVPTGMLITQYPKAASTVLNISGIIQTIPSIALLGFFIPLLGIGFWPAMAALFLYALLPIVRNTYTGLQGIDEELLEAARALGLKPHQVLFKVKLPLAAAFIMAGVRTATVINIGTATLAAFIGAGGLGEYIFTGITLNNNQLILKGAIPAALLALFVDGAMAVLEKKITPKGLKIRG